MSAPVVQSQDCCSPCESPVVENVPGPAGADGAAGAAGTNGTNAFSTTSAAYTQPAVGATVAIAVVTSAWAIIGEDVYVENGGYYLVTAIADGTHITIQNRGYPGNAAPAAVIGAGQRVGASGLRGATGGTGVGTLNSISPTTTRGDIIVDNGATAPVASDVRLPAGTDGQQLTALAAQPTGLIYRTITPNAATDNVVPRFDASGATTPTPVQASGLLVTDDGAVQSTPTGGNARGSKAVDLQVQRGAATQVASGANSVIGGGKNNTASGASSIAEGEDNVASGAASVASGASNIASGANSAAIGNSNTASGANAVAIGSSSVASNTNALALGPSATASGSSSIAAGSLAVASDQLAICIANDSQASAQYACVIGGSINAAIDVGAIVLGGVNNRSIGAGLTDYSAIIGGLDAYVDHYGQLAHSSGKFSVEGDAQSSELIWRRATTDATVTELFLDGAAKRAVMFGFSSWAFEIITIARNTTTDLSAVWKTSGGIKRSAGVVSLIGVITHALLCNDGEAWMLAGGVAVDADVANVSLRIRVTGAVATNIQWVARARLVQVHY